MIRASFLHLPVCWQYSANSQAENEMMVCISVDFTDEQLDQIERLLSGMIKLEELAA